MGRESIAVVEFRNSVWSESMICNVALLAPWLMGHRAVSIASVMKYGMSRFITVLWQGL
jgi:hypothetical protein